jgi:hypothetical protein
MKTVTFVWPEAMTAVPDMEDSVRPVTFRAVPFALSASTRSRSLPPGHALASGVVLAVDTAAS